jgi:hypothetical protein
MTVGGGPPSADVAEHAYGLLLERFAARRHRDRGLFHEKAIRGAQRRRLAYNWPFSHALSAAIDLYGIGRGPNARDLDDIVDALDRYWDARLGTGAAAYSSQVVRWWRRSAKFYDDNAWCGLDLLRLHRLDPSRPGLVERTSEVIELALGEHRRQSLTASPPCAPGGIHWQQQRRNASPEVGTVANSAMALLALRLFEVTRDSRHLDLARALHSWVERHMRDPTNGLYWDHLTPPDCRVDNTQWSYNQGLMVGVNTLLFRITGDDVHAASASTIAAAALDRFDLARLDTEPIEFAVVLFRNLLLWATVESESAYRARVQERAEQYLRMVWPRFVVTPSASRGRRPRLIEQAAIVELLALRCWPPDRHDLLV